MMNFTNWSISMLFFVLAIVYGYLGIILPKAETSGIMSCEDYFLK